MVLPMKISQNTREKLGLIVCIAYAVLAACGGVVIGLGVYMQIHINNQLILLESYNSGMLPHFLISIGTLMVLLNSIAAKIGFDAGYSDTSERIRMVLVPLVAILAILCIVIMSAGIVCFSHSASIEEALHNGLKDSMKRYKNNINVKVTLDKLQMRSRCCGSRSYKDWFNVGWINIEFVDTNHHQVRRKMKDGDLYVDSVPFSCCSVLSRHPCTAHNIGTKSLHGTFDEKTLYRAGCTDTLIDKLKNKVLYPAGSFVLILFGFQTLVTILLRYLQTSVQSAYEEGDIEGTGRGFCFPDVCPAGCCPGDPDKYVRAGALKASRGEEITSDEETEESLFEQPSPGGTEESFLGEAQAGLDRMDQVQGFAGGAGGAGGAGDGGESHGGEDRGRDKNKSSKKNKKDKKDRSSSKSKKDGSKSKSKKDRSKSKSKKDRSKSKSKKESSKSPKKAKKGKEPKRPKSKSPKPGKTKKSPKSKRTGGGGRKFGKRR